MIMICQRKAVKERQESEALDFPWVSFGVVAVVVAHLLLGVL